MSVHVNYQLHFYTPAHPCMKPLCRNDFTFLISCAGEFVDTIFIRTTSSSTLWYCFIIQNNEFFRNGVIGKTHYTICIFKESGLKVICVSWSASANIVRPEPTISGMRNIPHCPHLFLPIYLIEFDYKMITSKMTVCWLFSWLFIYF